MSDAALQPELEGKPMYHQQRHNSLTDNLCQHCISSCNCAVHPNLRIKDLAADDFDPELMDEMARRQSLIINDRPSRND